GDGNHRGLSPGRYRRRDHRRHQRQCQSVHRAGGLCSGVDRTARAQARWLAPPRRRDQAHASGEPHYQRHRRRPRRGSGEGAGARAHAASMSEDLQQEHKGDRTMHKRMLSVGVGFAACTIVALFITPARAQAPDDCRQAAAAVPQAARPLSETRMRNLIALTRLLGYVRHFHPSDQAARADWDMLAIEGMRRIEPCAGPERLAAALEAYFRSVAPTVQVFPTGKQPEAPAGLTPPAGATDLKLLSWRHVGAGQGGAPRLPGIHHTARVSSPADGRAPIGSQPDQIFTADLGAGLTIRVPLKLYADAAGTLPHRALPVLVRDNPLLLAAQEQTSGDDRATRFAAVALAWNVFQNFYPYFDVVEADWPRELERALTTAATDPDARAFRDTLRRLVAALHDGHGSVFNRAVYAPTHVLPLAWEIAEDKLVITRVASDAAEAGLKPGDVVLAMNGEPIDQVLAREGSL